MRSCLLLRVGLSVMIAASPHAFAQAPGLITFGDTSIRTEFLATGFAGDIGGEFQISPTDVVPDGTGRLFVATLGGVVRTIGADGVALSTPYLTQAQTETTPASNGEWGMTAVAFHPDFLDDSAAGYGKFYTITTEPASANGGVVDFSVAINHQDVIKEWTADDPLAAVFSGTVREVMRVGQPVGWHNVVDLAFDDDGYLFVSSGDGGRAAMSVVQSLDSVHGKILKIDPLDPMVSSASRGAVSANGAYRVPATNPFVGEEGALGEVWALGFRSPFRMNVDRQTGDLWVGDVGAGSLEEVDRVVEGGNYGWPFFEGTRQRESGAPDDVIEPVFEYSRDDGATVIGGFVYRGTAIPELQGKYVFADLGASADSARLFYGDPATGEEFEFMVDPLGDAFEVDIFSRGGGAVGVELQSLPARVISIGEDANGELYLAAVRVDPRSGGGQDGVVVRLLPALTPGDYNADGVVDAADYAVWRENPNRYVSPADDYGYWADNYGREADVVIAIPEPVAVGLIALSIATLAMFAARWALRDGRRH